jgi:hypothetical protein
MKLVLRLRLVIDELSFKPLTIFSVSYDGILCMEGDRRLGGVFAN